MKGEACDLFLLGCQSRPNKAELETADVYGNGVLHYACMSRDSEQVVFVVGHWGSLEETTPPKKSRDMSGDIESFQFFTGASADLFGTSSQFYQGRNGFLPRGNVLSDIPSFQDFPSW